MFSADLKETRRIYSSKQGYCISPHSWFALFLILILTCGTAGLACLWSRRVRKFFYTACDDEKAEFFILRDEVDYEYDEIQIVEAIGFKYFEFKCYRFILTPATSIELQGKPFPQYESASDFRKYTLVTDRSKDWSINDVLLQRDGLTSQYCDTPSVRIFEGYNVIDVPITPLLNTVAVSALGPIEIYQYCCCALWFAHDYSAFATVILVSIWVSMGVEIYFTRKARLRMKEMSAYDVAVNVLRDGKWMRISSIELFVGDVISLAGMDNTILPCDLVLLEGDVVVDESSLTGESLPVVKQGLTVDCESHAHSQKSKQTRPPNSSCLFSGSTVVSVPLNPENEGDNVRVKALVSKIGFNTAKGCLVRSMMFPKPIALSFQQEIRMFLLGLVTVALCFFGTSLWLWTSADWLLIYEFPTWLKALESIAILVPPTLPLIFYIGIVMSSANLKKKDIYTSNSSCIPIAGKVATFCFDKTGTLTKPELDVISAIPIANQSPRYAFGTPVRISSLPDQDLLLHCLATCHELTRNNNAATIDFTCDGSLSKPQQPCAFSGSQLDIKLMLATGWDFQNRSKLSPHPYSQSPITQEKLHLLHRFSFDHTLQLSSVVVEYEASRRIVLFAKGSPEAVASHCITGVPALYAQTTERFAKDGFYTIAFAWKELSSFNAENPHRHDYECQLNLLGFVVLRNEPKDCTANAICQLKSAFISPKIVTGDNIYTAFYIAKKCKIVETAACAIGKLVSEGDRTMLVWNTLDNPDVFIPHRVLEGRLTSSPHSISLGVSSDVFEYCATENMHAFLFQHVTIFARMKPHQKEKVVSIMKKYEFTGMCGDGANDCSALAAAHCGIALSQTEASISSPFCSCDPSIQSVVNLVHESRACLANSFGGFKFTIFYGILQTTQMLVAYAYFADLTQWMYMYEDFVLYFVFAVFLAQCKPSSVFFGDSPTFHIFGVITLTSLFGQLVIWIIMLASVIFMLSNEQWYSPEHKAWELESTRACAETTSVFYVGNFVLIGAAITWSLGGIWRESVYKNIGILVTFIITVATSLFIMFGVDHLESFRDFVGLDVLPLDWRLILLLIAALGVAAMIIFEKMLLLPYFQKFALQLGRM